MNDDDRSLPADNNHQLELHEENKRPRDSPVDNMIPIARCTEIPFSRFLPEKNADYLDIFVTTQYPPPSSHVSRWQPTDKNIIISQPSSSFLYKTTT